MTLETEVAVLGPVNTMELHMWVNENLLNAPWAHFQARQGTVANEPEQGLDAWLITYHNNGEPFPAQRREDYDSDEDFEWECGTAPYRGETYVLLDFDTAYGFNRDGLTCGGLHAVFITRLAREFFEPRGLEFAWKNEFTGEWFKGVEGLETLHTGAGDAVKWFNETVIPVIAATSRGAL